MNIFNLLENYSKSRKFTSNERDLTNELLVKSKRIISRNLEIVELNDKIVDLLNSKLLTEKEMNKFVKRIMIEKYGAKKNYEPIIKSISSSHGIDDKLLMSDEEQNLEDLVRLNYEDMWRIEQICEKSIIQLKFKTKGVRNARNNLIVHAGQGNASELTRDSFVISSEGPIVKGSRRINQKDNFKNSGSYYKDYEEFLSKFFLVLSKK